MKMTIAPQRGVGLELSTGDILEVIDPRGQQVADLFCFARNEPSDSFSAGRTIDYEEKFLLSTGSILYAHSGTPMFKIVSDTCGRHDLLVTPCSLQMFEMMTGTKKYHPSCLENLELAFAPFPVFRDKISTTFNIFMNVTFDERGHIKVETPLSQPGDRIQLLALIDLYVGLTACSDEGSNGGRCKEIEYQILRKSVE